MLKSCKSGLLVPLEDNKEQNSLLMMSPRLAMDNTEICCVSPITGIEALYDPLSNKPIREIFPAFHIFHDLGSYQECLVYFTLTTGYMIGKKECPPMIFDISS